uniref:Sec-independent protein translocase protein n=1 Tax=Cyanidium caldarium TaxID=2771 RepID=A0A7H0WBB1_CYACA|nr:Sec-independent protein translocase protein [Cyanidium caldarium]QNR39840.1 Sec-independent protein translocase protein [Cyanidium caldarium]
MITPFKIYTQEWKWRFIYSVICLITTTLNFYMSIKIPLSFLIWPTFKYNNIKLIATEVSEIFKEYVFISLTLSTFICFPFLIYQIFSFFSNAWYKSEKKKVKNWIFFNCITIIYNCLLIYFYIIPFSWNFFSNFQLNNNELYLSFNIQNEIKIVNYIKWIFSSIFTIGNILIFPLGLILLNIKININNLKNIRRYFIIFCLFLINILDLDIMTQLIISLNIFIYYEISILNHILISKT